MDAKNIEEITTLAHKMVVWTTKWTSVGTRINNGSKKEKIVAVSLTK
jgi:hypothetical protein